MKIKSQPAVLAITLYRPPKHCPTLFTDLSELLSIVLESYDKILVFGDLIFMLIKRLTPRPLNL
jgi:hypothetical protein